MQTLHYKTVLILLEKTDQLKPTGSKFILYSTLEQFWGELALALGLRCEESRFFNSQQTRHNFGQITGTLSQTSLDQALAPHPPHGTGEVSVVSWLLAPNSFWAAQLVNVGSFICRSSRSFSCSRSWPSCTRPATSTSSRRSGSWRPNRESFVALKTPGKLNPLLGNSILNSDHTCSWKKI